MSALLLYHQEKLAACQREIDVQSKKSQRIFYSRSLIFIASVVLIIFFIKTLPQLSLIILGLTVVIFLLLLRQEIVLKRKNAFLKNLISIHETEIRILNKEMTGLNEGNEFINKQHPFIADLDIFGKRSVFQLLNRTSTYTGKRKLAEWLWKPFLDPDTILQRQEAIKECATDKDWAYNFIATGSANREGQDDKEIITTWLVEAPQFSTDFLNSFTLFLPVITLTFAVLSITDLIPNAAFYSMFVLQLLITAKESKKVSKVHDRLSRRFDSIEKYRLLIELIESRNFNAVLINEQKQRLKTEGPTAGEAIRDLKKLTDLLDARMNLIVAILMNGLLLWDLNVMRRIEKWKVTHKSNFEKWIAVTGELDAYVSLGMYAANNPSYVYPEIEKNGFMMEAENIGHPMINENKLVKNDYSLKGKPRIDLLTGANMAGKSTFLRTIGVNLVLARIGAPVCAERYRFSPVKLFTSLRTNDSLQENESFFYAELKRLNVLTNNYEKGEEIFFLLDEILKGTNSKDQHLGSVALIKKIIRLNGIGIVATHDVELSKMIDDHAGIVRNLCFDIQIRDNKLDFSYKLTPGVCSTMNASFLMKQMGIVD